MSESRRFASFRASLLLAFVGFSLGCAMEEPYAGWTAPPAPSPPLSAEDVMKLLHVGIAENAIFSKVRWDGLAARPTIAEIQALRQAGATEGFIAGHLAAAIPNVAQDSSEAPVEFQFFPWPPFHSFPGLWPFTG